MRATSTVSCVLAVVVAAVTHGPAAAQSNPNFEGTWEGTIDLVAMEGVPAVADFSPEEQNAVRIQVRGPTANVTLGRAPIRPAGGFRIDTHDAAALIYANAASDTWIETWQISATKTDANTLLVFLWRVVNNKYEHPDWDTRKFVWGGVGQLKRAQSPSTAPD